MSLNRAKESARALAVHLGVRLWVESRKDEGSPHRHYTLVLGIGDPSSDFPNRARNVRLFEAEGIKEFMLGCRAFEAGCEYSRSWHYSRRWHQG